MSSAKKNTSEITKEKFNPEQDKYLESNFTVKTLGKRTLNKTYLQKKSGLVEDKKKPLLAVFLPMLKEGASENLNKIIEGLKELDLQLIVLHENADSELKKLMTSDMTMQSASIENLHQTLAGADIFLVPSALKRKGFATALALKYGCVPILSESETLDVLTDYEPSKETGAAFVYRDNSVWSMFASVVRALETYRLSYDWKGIQRNAMGTDLESYL